MSAFAAHPEQWDWVREDPGPPEGRRCARWCATPARSCTCAERQRPLWRSAATRIAKGDKVVLWYISGNRDEAVFEDPDRFDVSRLNVPHIGFGTGQHVCVGWRLAELQLRVAFRHLAARVKRFEQVGQPRRFRSNFINGLKNLDLKLVPA